MNCLPLSSVLRNRTRWEPRSIHYIGVELALREVLTLVRRNIAADGRSIFHGQISRWNSRDSSEADWHRWPTPDQIADDLARFAEAAGAMPLAPAGLNFSRGGANP